MIRGIISNEIRFLAILEIELAILKECGLIAFDGEVVMGLTIQAQIIGEFTLGRRASAVISLPWISMASSRGMAVLISLVCFNSSLPTAGRVPTFFGCSRPCADDR